MDNPKMLTRFLFVLAFTTLSIACSSSSEVTQPTAQVDTLQLTEADGIVLGSASSSFAGGLSLANEGGGVDDELVGGTVIGQFVYPSGVTALTNGPCAYDLIVRRGTTSGGTLIHVPGNATCDWEESSPKNYATATIDLGTNGGFAWGSHSLIFR